MIHELVKTVLDELKIITKAGTVIGEPIRADQVTLIPVSKISIGFGAGGGKAGSKGSEGEGTGGGVSIEPLAFVVIREGRVELLPMHRDSDGLGQVMELIPQIVGKIKDLTGKKNMKKNETGKEKK